MSCSPIRVRRGADVGTVLDVGTVNEAGRAVLAVLVMVDNAGPDCREWWPAAGCELEGSARRVFADTSWAPDDAPNAEALAVRCPFCGALPGAPCGAFNRVHAVRLPKALDTEARATRAARVGRRILAELRDDGVSRGTEADLSAVVGDLVGRDDVPELGRVLRDVAREMATPEGLTDATAAALTEAIDTLDTEARRS